MKTIITVTGIRPDFIRMSQIIKELDEASWCNHILIHSGQHYDNLLSGIFFEDLQIRSPDFNLSIGAAGKKHYEQQADLGVKIIECIEENNFLPDVVLFLGDSNSVLASVPLRKEGFKIGHIEAGMRSYDERMLEEINRKVCDHVSNYLFVYHKNYKEKAMKEGISEDKIFVVGNTIVEPLKNIADLSYKGSESHIILDIHRPENFNNESRLGAIVEFAIQSHLETGLPVMMLRFGRTMKAIEKFGIDLKGIEVIDLMGYKKFVRLMQDSKFIISDSGTAQEEPAVLNIPVLVPRDFTERPESILNNNSRLLVVEDRNDYKMALEWVLGSRNASSDWLGDGNTSKTIVNLLKEQLK